jgi:NAD(P)-dependent dehydrogenase (short-subunit alcohol dehydrogenase family)
VTGTDITSAAELGHTWRAWDRQEGIMNLADKVVVVTGAGSGMGREVALELLRRRARVAAIDINDTTLRETVTLAPGGAGKMATYVVNITDRAAVEALPQAVVDRFGSVDGIVNCAGIIQPFVRLNDLDYAAIDRVMDVNFRGTLYMTKTFLPWLLERPEAHIVNVSSMGGFMPVPGQTIYGASKAAVKLMTEGLHSELRHTRVRVTVVFPGAVATNITVNSGVATPAAAPGAKEYKALAADKAAKIILDGMEQNQYRVLVGSDAKMLDRLYRLHPRRAAGFLANQMKDLLGP